MFCGSIIVNGGGHIVELERMPLSLRTIDGTSQAKPHFLASYSYHRPDGELETVSDAK